MELRWTDGAVIKVTSEDGTAVISANREGLISLGNHLLTLSREKPGTHIHYDEHNSLEDGSSELVIEKTHSFPRAIDLYDS